MATSVISGDVYKHHQGGLYMVLCVGLDSNNHANREDVVVYLSLSSPHIGCINTRWLSEFLECVKLPSGRKVPRFSYAGTASKGPSPKD